MADPLRPDEADPGALLDITRLLRKHAEERPGTVALRFPVKAVADLSKPDLYEELTFGELEAQVEAYACGLRAVAGISRGDRVLFLLPPETVGCPLLFALLRLRALVIVVLPHILGAASSLSWIRRLRPRAVIGPPALLWAAGTVFRYWFSSVSIWVARGSGSCCGAYIPLARCYLDGLTLDRDGTEAMRADDPALVMFTTGSTGPAKPVLVTHGMVHAQLAVLQDTFAVEAGWSVVDNNFALAIFYLAAGMTTTLLHLGPKRRVADVKPEKVLAVVAAFEADLVCGSYMLWANLVAYCAQHSASLAGSVRLALAFGAPIPLGMHRALRATVLPRQAQLFTPYGATECLPIAVVSTDEVLAVAETYTSGGGICVGISHPSLCVGLIDVEDGPVDGSNVVFRFADDVAPRPGIDGIGEIVVAGPIVSPAYLDVPEADAANKIVAPANRSGGGGSNDGDSDGDGDGDAGSVTWHRTGDLGYFDENGRLWYCGRRSHRLREADSDRIIPTVPVETVANEVDGVFRSALVSAARPQVSGENGQAGDETLAALVVQPEAGVAGNPEEEMRVVADITARINGTRWSGVVKVVLFHADPFPVDPRHNSKIDRPALAVWAAGALHEPPTGGPAATPDS